MSDTAGAHPGGAGAISPAELKRLLDAGEPVTLLDVRNRDEVDEWRIEGPSVRATHVPYMKFLSADVQGTVGELAGAIDGPEPVTVVCGEGEASASVAEMLADAGLCARNLEDGMRGWARVYEAREIATEGPASIYQYQRPSSGCLGYLVAADGAAAVVDPLRAFVDRYVDDAAALGVEIVDAIDTHVHADHVSGVRRLAEGTGARPVLPEPAADRGVTFDVSTVTDGDTLQIGDGRLEAVHTPGHTTGMTSFLVDDRVLLTGDGLFVEGVPRPDLEEGAEGARAFAATLYDTITGRLSRFPDDVVVAPGHYSDAATPAEDGTYTARLGDLRERLRVFSMTREEFVDAILEDVPPRPANFERIVETNLGRADVDDDEAFELELGPNNCAASPTVAD